MPTTTEQLLRLRFWFVVYSLFTLVIGTWVSVAAVDALRSSSLPSMDVLDSVPDAAIIAWSLLVGVVVIALGLFLFQQLLQRKSWARAIMLVIAWLTGVSALLGLLSACGTFSASGWLAREMPGIDWGAMGLLNGLSNLASLAFSAFTIRTLQFDRGITQEFSQPADPQRQQ